MSHQEILRKYNIIAKKSLWQNFLVNDNILDKIVDFIDLSWKNIIEVWPWYWALTEKIISKKPNILELVELDRRMIEIINDRLVNWDFWTNADKLIHINNIDILKYFPDFQDYIVVANIPYYITSPILTHFFYSVPNIPSEMIILMQRDVADKIRKVKWNKNSVLSLGVDFACEEVREIVTVAAGNFIPAPKVESAVLYFKLRSNIDKNLANKFLKIIKSGFAEKRKKLSSNLCKIWWFDKTQIEQVFKKLNLSDNIRAEELDLPMWLELIGDLK